jgi:predicted nucleotidyltransferase
MHAALGHTFPARSTTDLDLGIAAQEWNSWQSIHKSFPSIGSNGIRYQIAGLPVDVMPFGQIESPEGYSHPHTRREEIVVFGFRDVYSHALQLELPSGLKIKIPQPAGYGALKMRSWLDRSIYGEYKDVQDLALLTYWYRESESIEDRIFSSEGPSWELYVDLDMRIELTAARLLVQDIKEQLTDDNYRDLSQRWLGNDKELMAREFMLPLGAGFQYDRQTRLEIINQFTF